MNNLLGTFYGAAGYVPPGGTKAEKQRRQEAWDEYQRQQAEQEAMNDIPDDTNYLTTTSKTTSRRRADSLQSAKSHGQSQSSFPDDVEASSNYLRGTKSLDSDRSYDNHYSPVQSTSQGGVRRISGNFNAPTIVEMERHKESRRRNKFRDIVFKGWSRRE